MDQDGWERAAHADRGARVPPAADALYIVETDFGRSDPPVVFDEALKEWRRVTDSGLKATMRPYKWVLAEQGRRE